MTVARQLPTKRPAMRRLKAWVLARLFTVLRKRPPLLLLLVNLLPVACVILFGWDVGGLMLCYWAENVIIGAFTVPRMVAAGVAHGIGATAGAVFYLPLFIGHYGIFCLGHGFFLLALLALAQQGSGEPIDMSVLAHIAFAQRGLWISIFGMVLFHAQELIEWLRRGAAKETSAWDEMSRPYGRVGVLHLALMGGMMVVMVVGHEVAAVAFLGIGKTVLELVRRRPRVV